MEIELETPATSSSSTTTPSKNKRKNFKPRNICVYNDDQDNQVMEDENGLTSNEEHEIDTKHPVPSPHPSPSISSDDDSYSSPPPSSSISTSVPGITQHFLNKGCKQNNVTAATPGQTIISNNNNNNNSYEPGHELRSSVRTATSSNHKQHCNAGSSSSSSTSSPQFQPLDLSQGDSKASLSTNPSPEPVASLSPLTFSSKQNESVVRPSSNPTTPSSSSSSQHIHSMDDMANHNHNKHPSSSPGTSIDTGHVIRGAENGYLGFWRPGIVSGIAPWIDPVYLTKTGAMASKIDALQRSGSVDYTRYVKRFANAAECDSIQCHNLNYREHFHCLDCNSRVFVKKEEMIRHFKWHKKRDESLQHGFMRYSPCDDCSDHFRNCAHNRKQTHYHCLKRGCEKTYISTSDVQMHANYHRKDTAIIQEGFQRFRATEDCLTETCNFMGQKTTHFHCRRGSCNFTFKNKADMEKHKSFHIKDEQLTRDGFKKFTKHETCGFDDCRFSRVCNHIHCIRQGCNHVFHSSGQLYSHKRKHDKCESDAEGGGGSVPSPGESGSQDQLPLPSLLPPNSSLIPPPTPIMETYPTGTTLTSIDGLPVFKRKRGRPPKNQVPEQIVTRMQTSSTSLSSSTASLTNSVPKSLSSMTLPHQLHHGLNSGNHFHQGSKHGNNQVSPSHFPASAKNQASSSPSQGNPFESLPLALSPFGLAAAAASMNGSNNNSSSTSSMIPTSLPFGSSSSCLQPPSGGSFQDGLIPVPMLPLLQLFNLPMNPSHPLYGLQSQLLQMQSQGLIPSSMPHHPSMPSLIPQPLSHTSAEVSSEGNHSMDNMSDDGNASGDGSSDFRSTKQSSTASSMIKEEAVPEGYKRYRFNEDCGYSYCSYREHQTHFHCLRKACGYSFCDKTRFVQHTARHSKLDSLMGDDFHQYRSNVKCDFKDCPYSGPIDNQESSANKGSHFHCLKCDFVCTDTNRVTGHRKQHHKMDSINAAGFEKYTPSQECGVSDCPHGRKQTHYHCLKCQYTVLGLSQMSSHKYKHTQENQ